MNFKRKTHKRKNQRKEMRSPTNSLAEWSRMLHKWWKIDVIEKRDFRKILESI